ncbi:rod shape-determining protein RodA [Candidatus Nitronereus thalassa]|uniref:Peptidoglycan glycosyltransferase RodA n=1 Tax=Candidatus Nitronereus thalassa TaxID=3020898 RepID=A0ABU3K8C1_9BACT|nr:rod shape-determining protein RodA [Candidatus Nitronereus thalassa]MDT7042609.1 rod shape-determining protein RodA [Candidatus Nitronereus thalassa]
MTRTPRFDGMDLSLLGVIASLLSVGVLTIYSVTSTAPGGSFPIFAKQAIWIGVGTLVFLVMASFDYHKLARLSYILYGLGLLLLVVVMFSGKVSRGSQRWISLGPIAIQPSEFIKLPLLLMLATYYSTQTRTGWLYRVIVPGLLALPGFLLILKQPDLGSSLSFLAIYITLLLAVGVKSKAFGLVLLTALMMFPFAWGELWGSLHDYQKERIISFVDPGYDPGGKGYQGLQSRIAIGSGELLGKGLRGGTQTQFKFLPEGHTDFVFAVFAEEWGFLGAVVLIMLFLSLFLLGLDIASKAKDMLGALLAIGVVGMITFNVVVNIAMTLGLAPIVGIPLPLLSYGGSATIMTMAVLGLLLSVKRRRLTLIQ